MFNDERKGQLDVQALEQARAEGKRIGLVMGSWDQCHIGHIRYLKKAKEECDYLIVGVDSDEKIRYRKGPNRPLIPQDERYDTIMEIGVNKVKTYEFGKSVADDIVFKPKDEPKWDLIKRVRPDVLIAIPENYSMEDVDKLTNEYGVGRVAIFGRQAETSSSNKLRKILIANMSDKIEDYEKQLEAAVKETTKRWQVDDVEPYIGMKEHLKESSDWKTPVVAAALVKDKWYYSTNQCDHTLPKKDLMDRTELFYSTTTHAEINLLKRIGEKGNTDTIYISLFPCDKCMKTLIDKGIKKIYYLEDHLERNWSKRSHALAEEKGIETIKVGDQIVEETVNERDYSSYKYIYPPNARKQEQLDIMIDREAKGEDPLAPENLDPVAQETLFETDHWCVTQNRYPYENAQTQMLVITKDDVYKYEDISKEAFAEIQEISKRLIIEYNLDGGALCWRYGDPAKSGASLKRVHFHVIMPEVDKKVKFSIGGNKQLKKTLTIKDSNTKEETN